MDMGGDGLRGGGGRPRRKWLQVEGGGGERRRMRAAVGGGRRKAGSRLEERASPDRQRPRSPPTESRPADETMSVSSHKQI